MMQLLIALFGRLLLAQRILEFELLYHPHVSKAQQKRTELNQRQNEENVRIAKGGTCPFRKPGKLAFFLASFKT